MLRARVTPELADRLELVETDANPVPAPDGVADRVLMVDVLHHLYDQPGALAEVTRLLRPGGLFVVVDWGDCERPVGPPLEHVLGLAAVRRVIASHGPRRERGARAGQACFPITSPWWPRRARRDGRVTRTGKPYARKRG